jgi:hypothetical protein
MHEMYKSLGIDTYLRYSVPSTAQSRLADHSTLYIYTDSQILVYADICTQSPNILNIIQVAARGLHIPDLSTLVDLLLSGN